MGAFASIGMKSFSKPDARMRDLSEAATVTPPPGAR